MTTNALEQRRRFVQDLATGQWEMSELCRRYGISRPTGYKWRDRVHREGEVGLAERSRAPHAVPHRTPAALEAQILAARRQYGWGARKLREVLSTRGPTEAWPAASTINDLLDRHQLLDKRRARTRWTHPGAPPSAAPRAPNQVWPADYKGQFKTGDGVYCYPLTITDLFSRRLMVCHGCRAITAANTQAVFRALFRAVGLPDAIRTDNGMPFAAPGLHGLSTLNRWWMQLGIQHQRIPPGQPQHNGAHERMHRELKRETTRPAAASLAAQQQRFATFQQRYNVERPHEGIANRRPEALWTPSVRPYPETLPRPEYPAALEVRRVSHPGAIHWRGARLFLSEVLRGEDVALEEVDDGIWNIVYYTTLLGRLDERTGQISGTKTRP